MTELYSNPQGDLNNEENPEQYDNYYDADCPDDPSSFNDDGVAAFCGDESLTLEAGSEACFSFINAFYN